MRKGNWTWMPHAGHYILGDRCRFVLNTHVGGYIVSTIGELQQDEIIKRIHAETHDQVYGTKWYAENKQLRGDNFAAAYFKEYGWGDLGAGERKYETMVFKAKKSNVGCCPFEMVSGEDVDFVGYESAEDARKGHMELCEKWSKVDEKPKTVKQLAGQLDIEEELANK